MYYDYIGATYHRSNEVQMHTPQLHGKVGQMFFLNVDFVVIILLIY